MLKKKKRVVYSGVWNKTLGRVTLFYLPVQKIRTKNIQTSQPKKAEEHEQQGTENGKHKVIISSNYDTSEFSQKIVILHNQNCLHKKKKKSKSQNGIQDKIPQIL